MEESYSLQKENRNKLFLVLFLFLVINLKNFHDLFLVWTSNEDYGHGFIILPISLYLIWKKREKLLSQPASQTWWGWVIVACWAIAYSIGTIGNISTIGYLSMILFPIGAMSVLISGQAAMLILFPAFFILFMFPIPSEVYTRVTNPLMLLSTGISFNFLSSLQIPLLQEGNLLILPNYTMEVVNACSGLRSLMTIMALSLIIGYTMTASKLLRTIFFFISIPIAILGNVIRLSATVMLAYFFSPQVAEGFTHTFAGIVTFFISLVILYTCMEIILWFSKKREPSPSS